MARVAIRTEKLVHTYPRGNVMALKGVDSVIYSLLWGRTAAVKQH